MKTYVIPHIAILRRSANVMETPDGFNLYSTITEGDQFGNGQIFEQETLPKARSVWE